MTRNEIENLLVRVGDYIEKHGISCADCDEREITLDMTITADEFNS